MSRLDGRSGIHIELRRDHGAMVLPSNQDFKRRVINALFVGTSGYSYKEWKGGFYRLSCLKKTC